MSKNFFSHETVIMDKGVKVGKNTKIWHWTHISSNVSIGGNCTLGQNVFVGSKVNVSYGVKIQNNVSIYTGVKINKNCFIGPSVVFTNVLIPRSFINQKNKFLKTVIGEGVSIGANSTIICGNSIGKYAFIGANTLVNMNLKPFGLYVGNPCRRIGWISVSGKKLELPVIGFAESCCPVSKIKYILKNEKIITNDTLKNK